MSSPDEAAPPLATPILGSQALSGEAPGLAGDSFAETPKQEATSGRLEQAPRTPEASFVALYQAQYPRLVRALMLAGADLASAEDHAQEAFARILVRWDKVARGPSPAGYVFVSGFRAWRRGLRRRALWNPGSSNDLGLAVCADAMAQADSEMTLRGLLGAMPPKRRAVAVMCLVEGLSVAEASVALGLARGTVRKHLGAARSDLAALLER